MAVQYITCGNLQGLLSSRNPLLMLISLDGERVILGDLYENEDHGILLAKTGRDHRAVDLYFRLVLDYSGADWVFVCPQDYRGITGENNRIAAFYKDGFSVISHVLADLGYMVGINIPRKYARRLRVLAKNE
ncbi:hypothetical protein [Neobittarella massiliensis]|uniref:hypothetical protein n=1 Tax=Neobittarella massiliensis (ex Bilen et al. 2018) TaxID=2041842 RepID=UPI000CF65985|nr:hypothetical protein [Neobittarella massiliensis]